MRANGAKEPIDSKFDMRSFPSCALDTAVAKRLMLRKLRAWVIPGSSHWSLKDYCLYTWLSQVLFIIRLRTTTLLWQHSKILITSYVFRNVHFKERGVLAITAAEVGSERLSSDPTFDCWCLGALATAYPGHCRKKASWLLCKRRW